MKVRYGNYTTSSSKLTAEQMAAQIPESWVDECPDWSKGCLNNNVFEKGESRAYHFWHEYDVEDARE